MANAYGRGAAAQAQRGADTSSYYDYNPAAAEEYLSGSRVAEYRGALDTLGESPAMKKSGKFIGGHRKMKRRYEQAIEKAQRLRELAAGRAFDEFKTTASQYSKPWLLSPSRGEPLISGQTAAHGLAGLRSPGGRGGPGGSLRQKRSLRRRALMGEHEFGALSVDLGL